MKMMRTSALLTLAALSCVGAFSQSTEKSVKFEATDVHSSPHLTQPQVRGPFFSSGRYELRFATMLDLIRVAYNVDPEKVSGGPSWLEMDRFDVFGKIPAASTVESRRLMLQAVLADRFKLAIHNDTRQMPAFALVAGKHLQLKESDSSEPGKCELTFQNPPPAGPPANGAPIQLPVFLYTCHNTSMAEFASKMLSIPTAPQYLNNKLVADQTELKGTWDFTLKFTPKVPAGIATVGESITLFDALEKQLGLELRAGTVPLPVIVIDSVDRKPTENTAEALKSFPPLPEEFEVASLKLSPPDANAGRGGRPPDIKNGRLYLPGISLKNLITIGWDLRGDDFFVDAPKWLDDDRYDILAKAPAEVAIGDLTPQQRNNVPVNIDALRPMIRSLVIERFKMKWHMEDRPINAYTLSAAKPKLTKADPASRTRWQEGTLPESKGNKNANASLGRLVTCQNVTMAQFADLLPGIAPGYLRTDVVDKTGLEGGWDFTFSFSPAGVLQIGRGPGSGDGAGSGGAATEASEPTAAISLFDALNKQLGLKLEAQKRPASVLVIEHLERKPIEN